MSTTEQEINDFFEFAKSRLRNGGSDSTLAELVDEWTLRNPPPGDADAITASLRDMENGDTGQPFEEFAADFRKRNSLNDSE